ncbi:hypothetical protein BDF14DRAFT_1800125, partial [Spinellus fusiger]
MTLFIGKLPSNFKEINLEDIYYKFGKITRCEVKRGVSFSYGFVEYVDKYDAEDALIDTEGMEIDGIRIIVEYAKSKARRSDDRTCFRCGEEGHWARDCSSRARYSHSRDDSRRRYRSPSPLYSRSHSRPRSYSYKHRGRRSNNASFRSRSRSRSYSRSGSYSRSPPHPRSLSHSLSVYS